MRKRTAHRWRLSLTMLLFVLVALGTFWLVELMNQSGQQMQADRHRNEPDYIIERFSFVRMNQAGQPSYIISGDKLTHLPLDDSSDIELPVVRSLAGKEPGQQPPMQMHAARGRVDQNNSRVRLDGDVNVEGSASAASRAMQLKTESLTVFPDDDTMETALPVALSLGNATANGVGMRANNATRQVQLGGRGQLVLPPRGAPAPPPLK